MMAHHQVLWITSSRICIPNIGIFQGVSMEGKFPREHPKMDLSMPFTPISFSDDLSLNLLNIYFESSIENWFLFLMYFHKRVPFLDTVFSIYYLRMVKKKSAKNFPGRSVHFSNNCFPKVFLRFGKLSVVLPNYER